MIKLGMTLSHHTVREPMVLGGDGAFHTIYVIDGVLEGNGERFTAGNVMFTKGRTSIAGSANVLQFCVSAAAQTSEHILSAEFEHARGDAVIRFDQVSFPACARAYRHIHPGAGIRYLVSGALEIKSDHEATLMKPGDAWFEDANSPVQATAEDIPETSFIRMLVLPAAYLGKPTIKLLNPADEALPKKQTNKRFFDQLVQF